ncbi:MAG: hypothetical protein M3463_19505 [Verrucomicrobiota bacterium]|nr:hypothetical protein [Verrucomicrobiota bacterium]
MRSRNLAKPFSIAGLILAEIYMLYSVLAPYRKGPPIPLRLPLPELPGAASLPPEATVPLATLITKILVCAVFFGVFGALVGLGIGLLVSALLPKR